MLAATLMLRKTTTLTLFARPPALARLATLFISRFSSSKTFIAKPLLERPSPESRSNGRPPKEVANGPTPRPERGPTRLSGRKHRNGRPDRRIAARRHRHGLS